MSDGSKQFVSDLNAAFGKRMEPEQREVYYAQLRKWYLSNEEWKRALELLTSDCQALPVLSVIYDYLKRAQRELRKPQGKYAKYVFELDGRNMATRMFDLASGVRPAIPERAKYVTLVVENPAEDQADHLPTRENARDAFRKGWIESGAEPNKCDAMFAAISRGQYADLVADYDDSLPDDYSLDDL